MADKAFELPRSLVRKHGTNDPFRIAKELNIPVHFRSMKRQKAFCLCVMRNYSIHINENLSDQMQRMACAHELGHIILHAGELRTSPLFDTAVYDKRSSTEYEANLFAADLLLPDEEVLRAAAEPEMNFSALCRSLDTVPELMNFKLMSMHRRGLPVVCIGECDSRFLSPGP